jgi:hypothetical protein
MMVFAATNLARRRFGASERNIRGFREKSVSPECQSQKVAPAH